MSFDEKIATMMQRIPKLKEHLETEEATKNALVMPFIAALGYDIFNPKEVIPEFTADVGTKKGEKVDYAIMKEGEMVFLIECKKAETDLSQANINQLYRYFNVTKARIAIVTNGLIYRFFSDLEEPNKMDEKPFLELNLEEAAPNALAEVRKMAKEDFDLDQMLSTASDLKYTSEIKKILSTQFESPEDEFVRFFFCRVVPKARFVSSMKIQFTALVKKAFQQFLSEKVNNRLRSALESEKSLTEKREEDKENIVEVEGEQGNGIVTTEEEIEGYYIVRAIVSKEISPNRIVHRDTKSYMGILLDDNNRKPICRLWFNSKQKYLGIFNKDKNETRIPINDVPEIYEHSDKILEVLKNYDQE